jgi:hypothetical protein
MDKTWPASTAPTRRILYRSAESPPRLLWPDPNPLARPLPCLTRRSWLGPDPDSTARHSQTPTRGSCPRWHSSRKTTSSYMTPKLTSPISTCQATPAPELSPVASPAPPDPPLPTTLLSPSPLPYHRPAASPSAASPPPNPRALLRWPAARPADADPAPGPTFPSPVCAPRVYSCGTVRARHPLPPTTWFGPEEPPAAPTLPRLQALPTFPLQAPPPIHPSLLTGVDKQAGFTKQARPRLSLQTKITLQAPLVC